MYYSYSAAQWLLVFYLYCMLGWCFESTVVSVGQRRLVNRGFLRGPMLPIYGFGAVLMTLALNRFHNAPVPVVFLVSAVIGGAFEYFVSWFMEYAFGWDYTGTFLNINGRTNFMFMCMWGALGVVWVKLALPALLHTVNLIPWRWRYSITALCAALMIFDGAMTLVALDCWYSRWQAQRPTTRSSSSAPSSSITSGWKTASNR